MAEPRTLTREAVRELDRRAIEEYGIPSIVLMENAGRRCADEAGRIAAVGTVLVLCGPGNNGGDGLVIARTLRNRGREVEVALVGELAALERASDDVQTNARLWRGLGGEIVSVAGEDDVVALAGRMRDVGLVVDALFGTGISRPVEGVFAGVIEAQRTSERPTLAVDLPSGLDANTGEVLGVAVRADVTVTFVAPKSGFLTGAGPSCCGRVIEAEIGIPSAFVEEALERCREDPRER